MPQVKMVVIHTNPLETQREGRTRVQHAMAIENGFDTADGLLEMVALGRYNTVYKRISELGKESHIRVFESSLLFKLNDAKDAWTWEDKAGDRIIVFINVI